MMNVDEFVRVEFFLESIDDLKKSIEGPTSAYRIRKAAGILRLLLVDNNSILTQVNKIVQGGKLKIAFTSEMRTINYRLNIEMAELSPAKDGEHFAIPDFMKMPFVKSPECVRTVGEVIKYVANKIGGAHYDYNGSGDPIMSEIFRFYEDVYAFGMGFRAIEEIGQVVVLSLSDLIAKAESDWLNSREWLLQMPLRSTSINTENQLGA